MTNSGPGADSRGSSEWDNPSWSSSPPDDSLSRPEEQPPNPWSREGSSATDPAASGRPDPGFDPLPTPPYGDGTSATSYGSPPPTYADPAPPYGAPPPAYDSNPYEASPYQPAYSSARPYGVVPVSHPQSTTAMIFGILGIVFGLSCGIGGLVGIPGIVQGRRARNEIDSQPGRYSGRSQAVAGIVTGTIGVVIAVVVVVVVIIAVAFAATSGEF
jgi:hypothetical protein